MQLSEFFVLIDSIFRRVVPAYGFQYMVEVTCKDEEVIDYYFDTYHVVKQQFCL